MKRYINKLVTLALKSQSVAKGRKLLLGFREDPGPSSEVSLGITTSTLAGYFKEEGEIFLLTRVGLILDLLYNLGFHVNILG